MADVKKGWWFIPILRLPNGELRDEIRLPLVDGRVFDDGTDPSGSYSFFSAVQGKPDYLTNCQQNNILPQGVSFRILGIAFDMQNTNAARRNLLPLLMERTSTVLKVGEKDYFKCPLLFLAGRLEQNVAVASGSGTTTAFERFHQKFGTAIGLPVLFTGKHVIDVAPLQNFALNTIMSGLTAAQIAELTNTPVVGLNNTIYASLKGLYRRPVQ